MSRLGKVDPRAFADVAKVLLATDAQTATKYLSHKLTVRGTHRGKRRKNDARISIIFSVGTPNYTERKFIKACDAAGERFPVRKVHLKMPPKPRRGAKR